LGSKTLEPARGATTTDTFLASQRSGIIELTISTLLIENRLIGRVLGTSNSTIVIRAVSVLIGGVPRGAARTEQVRVVRQLVSLLSAYLRCDDDDLQAALGGIANASEHVMAERESCKEVRPVDEDE